MSDFKPFSDDATSMGIGGLTVENGRDRIALYGQIDITRDKKGLALVRELKILVDGAEQYLAAQAELPDAVAPAKATKTVKNPFA
jgi:hypothetical protein